MIESESDDSSTEAASEEEISAMKKDRPRLRAVVSDIESESGIEHLSVFICMDILVKRVPPRGGWVVFVQDSTFHPRIFNSLVFPETFKSLVAKSCLCLLLFLF
jgi:hypothetical protein